MEVLTIWIKEDVLSAGVRSVDGNEIYAVERKVSFIIAKGGSATCRVTVILRISPGLRFENVQCKVSPLIAAGWIGKEEI